MGKLCLIDPETLLPQLQTALSSPSPLMRTTVVTAMKFTISDQPQPIGMYQYAQSAHATICYVSRNLLLRSNVCINERLRDLQLKVA
jgi:hypothetical protein